MQETPIAKQDAQSPIPYVNPNGAEPRLEKKNDSGGGQCNNEKVSATDTTKPCIELWHPGEYIARLYQLNACFGYYLCILRHDSRKGLQVERGVDCVCVCVCGGGGGLPCSSLNSPNSPTSISVLLSD